MARILLALVALAAVAAALPRRHHHSSTMKSKREATDVKQVDLAAALNHTVCPIEVHINEDPNRIPRRIKEYKCAPNPEQWCHSQQVPDNECCRHRHADRLMQCVEVRDAVVVQVSGRTQQLDVSVGCACMVDRVPHSAPLAR